MAAHSKKPLQNLRLTKAFYYAPGRVADETQFYTSFLVLPNMRRKRFLWNIGLFRGPDILHGMLGV